MFELKHAKLFFVQNLIRKLSPQALLTCAVTAMVLSRFRLGTSVIFAAGKGSFGSWKNGEEG